MEFQIFWSFLSFWYWKWKIALFKLEPMNVHWTCVVCTFKRNFFTYFYFIFQNTTKYCMLTSTFTSVRSIWTSFFWIYCISSSLAREPEAYRDSVRIGGCQSGLEVLDRSALSACTLWYTCFIVMNLIMNLLLQGRNVIQGRNEYQTFSTGNLN